jgi:hypothetical protein
MLQIGGHKLAENAMDTELRFLNLNFEFAVSSF